jgi:hypothetical protein
MVIKSITCLSGHEKKNHFFEQDNWVKALGRRTGAQYKKVTSEIRICKLKWAYLPKEISY